jgi:hypothetical protein
MSHLICLSTADLTARLAKLGVPVGFTAEERKLFETTPVVESPHRIFAFPTPAGAEGLNLMNLRAKGGRIFDHPWYYDEAFMKADCAPGWHVIHMDVLPGSIEQPLDYVRSLDGSNIVLPMAIEVTLMLFLHFTETGEQLLHKKHTWCSDTASLGRTVTVGAFGRNGLFISGHPAAWTSRGLGTCPKMTYDI